MKNQCRNSNTEMHHQVHRINIVPELAGRRSMSLVARSKNYNCSSVVYESNSYVTEKFSERSKSRAQRRE